VATIGDGLPVVLLQCSGLQMLGVYAWFDVALVQALALAPARTSGRQFDALENAKGYAMR
jgi:hypothetical protein